MKTGNSIVIFLIIVLVVMAASVSLTMGVSQFLDSFGPARLTAYFDREFSTPERTGIDNIPTLTPTADPSLIQVVGNIENSKTPFPTASNKPTPTVKATSTSAPVQTSSPTPTPAPTPVPDPDHCTIPLIYKVDFIAPVYFERGFTRSGLTDIIHESVKEWEDALSKDLFVYDENISGNINFTNEGLTSNTEGYGAITAKKQFKNGTVESFSIKTFGQSMFTFIDNANFSYFGSAGDNDDFDESLIRRTVLKQLGHAIGLGSLPYEQAVKKDSVMIGGGKWAMTSYMPELTPDDISFAKSFCD